MESGDCIFCRLGQLDLVAENLLAFAIRDKFPVRPLHTLIITKRHVSDIFRASNHERQAVHELAALCRETLVADDPSIGGFNFGSNVGEAAGQKIFHAHVHLIPRRPGDTPPPPARPG